MELVHGQSWMVVLTNTITKYGSTLYIGMDKVLAHYACIFKNSVSLSVLTEQNDS